MQSQTANYCPADQAHVPRRLLGCMVKRVMDLVFATLAIIVLSPLFILIAALVSTSGGPVLYRHARIGKNGKSFDCLKFSTMIPGATECLEEYLSYHPQARAEWESSRKLTFDPRATAVGRLLRRTSLDELPQLFNVLMGDMSLVGPSPVTAPELHDYGDKAELYRSVRPGITGLWQISGRNDVSYEQRVALDARYVREQSLWRDIAILLRTPRVVLARTGAR
jgi:exopolysaccharide production protein ExoY